MNIQIEHLLISQKHLIGLEVIGQVFSRLPGLGSEAARAT